MARYTKTPLGANYASKAAIDTNLDDIKTAIDDTLSRKGDGPNQMQADLDMNSNQILNLPEAVQPTEPVRLSQFEEVTDALTNGGDIDEITLASGQTTVNSVNVDFNKADFYIRGDSTDNGILVETLDYTVSSSSSIELTNSYPSGTKVIAIGKIRSTAKLIPRPLGKMTIKDILTQNANFQNISVWGHRCLKGYAPENTIEAALNAIGKGVRILECDISWTSDDVPVLMHDNTVDRTTDGTGNVDSFTLAGIQALDAGSWFSGIYTGVKVPSFEEWFDAVTEAGGVPLIEIKETGFTDSQLESVVDYATENNPSNNHGYVIRTESTFDKVRAINPYANIVYYPNTGEPTTVNADFLESRGNATLHLDIDYTTVFDFSKYTFPITALNAPYTSDVQRAAKRGFLGMGSDYFVEDL